tara:strand:- start:1179 stop:1607 length:429 start_codon:yes stop_codon:yes gene_type:complete
MSSTRISFKTLLITLFLCTSIFAKNSFFQEAEKLFKEKKYSQSKFKFEKDIVFNPKNEMSYLYLAKIFNQQKDDFMEEQNLNTVILLNPKNEEALYLLALLNIKKSDYDKSEKLIKDFKQVCSTFCNKESELIKKLENLEPK